ncbi:MAG TPA: HD domain-containing phosphohydrolase [Dehalococcoidia bacterium]|nr:HD domain-containing phosphohydrolase [Dehalococcoidia bacterium]
MAAAPPSRVRLAELLAALSLATDLGMGQPMEQALRTCLLSVAAGQTLGLDVQTLSEAYYLGLLRFIGCTADAHEQALLVGGDEIAHRAGLAPVVMGGVPDVLGYLARHLAADRPPLTRLRLLVGMFAAGSRDAKRSIAVHCEVAQMLATRFGLRASIAVGVGQLFEHWDGKGVPGQLRGAAIPLPVRIVAVARDVDVFHQLGGWDLASTTLQRRRGKAYDPAVVDAFLSDGEHWTAAAGASSAWEAVLAAEPGEPLLVGDVRLDGVLHALADFTDLKSPYTLGHSSAVADLAGIAAPLARLDELDTRTVQRAGLVHDLGRTGIPNGIWDKPGPLSAAEWERVRLHPYLSERILSYVPALRPLAVLAGAHHERQDGSGYHRGSSGQAFPMGARILAAADAYQAMTQPRPHRPALTADAAAAALRQEAASGRLDPGAVRAVLEAAGHRAATTRAAYPAGLTDREVEVLQRISRGLSNRLVAAELGIAPKTVARHIENLYAKLGVSSRPAAALFAMQHDLL